MRLLILSTTLLALAQSAVAAFGVSLSFPGSIAAGTAFTLSLTDAGGSPSLAQLQSGDVQLLFGGNTDATSQPLDTVASLVYATATSAIVTIKPGLGPAVTDGYYFAVRSVVIGGGIAINYSPRFSISGMTGSTQAVFQAAVVSDQRPDVAPQQAAPAAGAAGGQFTVPYNLQTGLTKYAPMQSMPPTKITKKNPTPLYPTSAYIKATTWLGSPTVLSTITAPQTVSVVSIENTAAAQPMPNANMAKFLARWKD